MALATPAAPQALTRSVPEVTVGGRRAVVKLRGLLPGAAGVWQITVARSQRRNGRVGCTTVRSLRTHQ